MHQNGNLQEMSDLVKLNIKKKDPNIRKIQTDQLVIQDLFLLQVLSLFWGFLSQNREQGQKCSAAPLRSDLSQCPHVPQLHPHPVYRESLRDY